MQEKGEQGMTLVEVLLVVIIMSVVASIALPVFSSLDHMQLELQSRKLLRAIRFARDEAIRTGYSHGVDFVESDTRMRLYKYDSGIDYSVYKPIERQPYELFFGTNSQPVSISDKSIKFASLTLNSQNHIVFAAGTGVPSSANVGSTNLLETASIEMGYRGDVITLKVAPITGRVTLE